VNVQNVHWNLNGNDNEAVPSANTTRMHSGAGTANGKCMRNGKGISEGRELSIKSESEKTAHDFICIKL